MLSEADSLMTLVLRECRPKLVQDLEDSPKLVHHLVEKGVLPSKYKRPSLRARSKVAQNERLIEGVLASEREEALDLLINHLRSEGKQPHLWTLLEYSKVKHKRLLALLGHVVEIHHM